MGLNPLSQIARFIGRSGKRIAVTVAGALVLITGIVMMVTPGPGVLLILAGLAILATEWAWAERALDKAKERTGDAIKVATASPLRIALSVVLTLGAIAGGIVLWLMLT